MTRPRSLAPFVALGSALVLALSAAPGDAQTGSKAQKPNGAPAAQPAPKYGGVLVTHPLSAPPSLSPHEESTVATVQAASPCFNNLVYFDPVKKQESVDTLIPELAEKWSSQDGYRNLVFFLRRDVRWHDGKPFTSPWLVIYPGVAISLAVFGTNLLGDALRDTLDPRLRGA